MTRRFFLTRAFLLLAAYLLYLWSWNHAFGDTIQLRGHLGKEELNSISARLDTQPQSLVLVINSNSGDLVQALELAKKIYGLKADNNTHVAAYIEDNAVGPAAIFPFLADELYISRFISWGDIPLGNEKVFSTNILRNRVVSLVDVKNPHANTYLLLAAAMCDPAVRLVNDRGLRQATGSESSSATLTSEGQTLVINHNQVQELGLVKGVLTPDQFEKKFPAGKSSAENVFPPSEAEAIPKALLMEELKKHIPFNPSGPNIVGHILIEDHSEAITQATWLYVKKALEYYKGVKPICIILELNTPGGEVFAAQKISDALKEMDTQNNIPVIAYINNWAISAGAMLAYSCRFIAVAKDASMGAAEPVIAGAEGTMEPASEKVNSALRADFANRARFFGRDPLIAEAMVDKDLILVIRHGRIVKLDNESQIRTEGTDPDVVLSPKGKLLTLDTEQMMSLGVADILASPTKVEPLSEAETTSGKWPAAKSALFHQAYFDTIPNATIDAFRPDWKMRFFALLASPVVSSLLMLGLMLGFYLEVTTPGFGLPGTLAVTCLFLIILSSFSLEIANWLELILLLVGLTVILVELFVLPTFGLLGFIGIIFFLMGLFGMMLPGAGAVDYEVDTHTLNAAGQVFFEHLAWLCGTFVVGVIAIGVLARYLTPNLPGFHRFVLKGSEQDGYTSVDQPEKMPKPGAKGTAATTLRPAGKVVIDDIQYDAISNGALIDRGDEIVVTGIDSGTLTVTKTEPNT